MLRALEIRDMLIIDRLELDLLPGLNVLTGETGAGKSILLDSLGFVLGWRGRAELVRSGAERGEVVAEFDVPEGHAVHAILDEAGLPGGETLILRRVNTQDGRKTAWVNDRRCSGDVLRQLSEHLIELHGQHDDRGLLDPKGHRSLLDQFAGLSDAKSKVRAQWQAAQKAQKTLQQAESALADMRAEEEFLRHAVGELDQLDPQPGEDAELDARRRLMQAAERVREDVSRAYQALGSDGAEGAMGDASRWLEGAVADVGEPLEEPLAALARAMGELGEAVSGVERCLDQLSFDPHELEHIEERLFAIRALARKHGVTPDELGSFAQDLRRKMEALDAGEGNIAALRSDAEAARKAFEVEAQALSDARKSAASRLDQSVMTELAPLKMERAVFTTLIAEETPGPEGIDAVSFQVATNPGAPAGPLAKIASGGELSRFLLALKVCLSSEEAQATMIFDEIDRGVGGATADAVGRRLASLAQGGQILVVTHSPQVAALGAHHLQVSKRVEDGMTLSTVRPLSQDERVDEIARMLSGDVITDPARDAARALLTG